MSIYQGQLVKVTENVKVKRRRVLSQVLTRADGQPISVVTCVRSTTVRSGSPRSDVLHGGPPPTTVDTDTSCMATTSSERNYDAKRPRQPLVRQKFRTMSCIQ